MEPQRQPPATLGALIFPGFQTLDLFGPLEMLGSVHPALSVSLVAESHGLVESVHGQRLCADEVIDGAPTFDLLLVPGGDRALEVGGRAHARGWLAHACAHAELVMAVCTGSVLVAMSGVLDGRRATTNKADFSQTTPLAPNVDWVPKARWVEDGKYLTSSGVTAGMDMTLAAISRLHGRSAADDIAVSSEYDWQDDPSRDPFAERYGLV